MNQTFSIWFILLATVIAANAPFFNQKLLLVFPLKVAKSLGIRLLEMLVFYFLVGGMALLIERQTGQIVSQGWEFYAITAALFVTCAFPGFVYRYLLKHR
ncbi:MAG: DUF2818 family protein [Polaromonas sp.]|jgi:hypothetical protein|nr:DUF2818 family protein [Polaromonas sp.]MBK9341216.1 DUF2818 family protein [Rhodoferax sp.]HOZ66021.1 DUF2818 family protein [Burkholderiaceae bacterium]MBK7026257.1 DUF2818 family protein [Polaromonas sp.]MBP6088850.1 DUF2818 family protein [Polaromonas sp.]